MKFSRSTVATPETPGCLAIGPLAMMAFHPGDHATRAVVGDEATRVQS